MGLFQYLILPIMALYALFVGIQYRYNIFLISKYQLNNSYIQNRLVFNNNINQIIKNYDKVKFNNNVTVYDLENKKSVTLSGLVFEKTVNSNTGKVFVTFENNNNYLYTGDGSVIENINKNLIIVNKGYMGELYYTGNSSTGKVINKINNEEICYYDGNTCN